MTKVVEARIYRFGVVIAIQQVPFPTPPYLSLIDLLGDSEGPSPIVIESLETTVASRRGHLLASCIGVEVDATGTWVRYFCSKP